MKVAILGYGNQGQSAYKYWKNSDNEVTVLDHSEEVQLPEGALHKLGIRYLDDLKNFDLIVRGPSVHPKDIVNANGSEILGKVTSVTNEFLRVCPTKNVIGVTGTKGKGTTSTLITKMLEASGKKVHLGGNIGIPPLDLLENNIQEDDWVVLELASFQTMDLHYSPHIAVCLLIAPEHLNWHTDMEEYIAAKQQLFAHQQPSDIAIYYDRDSNSRKVVEVSAGIKIPYFKEPGATVENDAFVIAGQTVCQTNELKLLGKHNWQNACAAITAVWQIVQDITPLRSAITNLTGLEHRLEQVKIVHDVTYYNDSFASAPDAAEAAAEAIPVMKVMILGGFDRGLPLEKLAATLKKNEHSLRKLLIIGAGGPRLATALETAGLNNFEVTSEKSMGAIVKKAQSFSEPGDAVVLSPGFPSFDMFKNFEERGLLYKEAVESLQ